MNDNADSPFVWWNARRLRYNIGLVVAGVVAFSLSPADTQKRPVIDT